MTRCARLSLLALSWAALPLVACDYTRVDVATQDSTAPCKDVAGVIAARTFACGGGHDRANARYDLFFEEYRCIPWDPLTTPYEELWHCSFEVGQLTCPDVRAFGDDFERYFAASPACPLIIRHADGTALPGGFVVEATE